jgi:hypothetical protein
VQKDAVPSAVQLPPGQSAGALQRLGAQTLTPAALPGSVKPRPPSGFSLWHDKSGSLQGWVASQRAWQRGAGGAGGLTLPKAAQAALLGQSLSLVQVALHRPRRPNDRQLPRAQAVGSSVPSESAQLAPTSPGRAAKQARAKT